MSEETTTDPVSDAVAAALRAVPEGAEVTHVEGNLVHCRYGDGEDETHVVVELDEELNAAVTVKSGPTMPAGDPTDTVDAPDPEPEAQTGSGAPVDVTEWPEADPAEVVPAPDAETKVEAGTADESGTVTAPEANPAEAAGEPAEATETTTEATAAAELPQGEPGSPTE